MKSLSEFSNHYTILSKQLISAIEQTYNDVHGNDNCTEHIFGENNRFYMYFCEDAVAVAVLVESLVKNEDGQILVSGCVPNFSTTEKDTWNLDCFDIHCLINLFEELKTDIKQRKIDYIKNYIINKGEVKLSNPVTAGNGIKIEKPCVRHFNGETSIVENGNDAGINIYAFPDEVIDSIYREVKNKNIKYKWSAESNDGAFEDESRKSFDTKRECYNDMRNAALKKMKWNTEFDEDFDDMEDGDYIGYKVKFSKDKIIHESYSGIYTYEIGRVYEE